MGYTSETSCAKLEVEVAVVEDRCESLEVLWDRTEHHLSQELMSEMETCSVLRAELLAMQRSELHNVGHEVGCRERSSSSQARCEELGEEERAERAEAEARVAAQELRRSH